MNIVLLTKTVVENSNSDNAVEGLPKILVRNNVKCCS